MFHSFKVDQYERGTLSLGKMRDRPSRPRLILTIVQLDRWARCPRLQRTGQGRTVWPMKVGNVKTHDLMSSRPAHAINRLVIRDGIQPRTQATTYVKQMAAAMHLKECSLEHVIGLICVTE